MIAPTIEEQLQVLRDAAKAALVVPGFDSDAETRGRAARSAAVLKYVADRIEVFANKAAAARS
jgi:hypothetical protein